MWTSLAAWGADLPREPTAAAASAAAPTAHRGRPQTCAEAAVAIASRASAELAPGPARATPTWRTIWARARSERASRAGADANNNI